MLRAQPISHPMSSPGCVNVTRPVSKPTIHAYSLARVIADQNPNALWQSPDDTIFHQPMALHVAGLTSVLRYCVTHTRSVNAGWYALAIPMSPATLPMSQRSH